MDISISASDAPTPLQLRGREEHNARHARLFAASAPPAKAKRPRPVSPFVGERPVSRLRKLFPVAIEEIDDAGNIVIPGFVVSKWKAIAREVAGKHGVTLNDLLSPRRNRVVVFARHEAFWRCKKETTLTLPEIGRRFGGKDHTTVLHGIRQHELRMAEAKYLTSEGISVRETEIG